MTEVGAGPGRRYLVTIVAIMLGQFVAIMNITLLTTALPTIIHELDATPVQGTWMISVTTLSVTVSSLVWGRLGDGLDPLLLMRIALGIVLLGVVLATLATSPLMLILGRAVQGLGFGGAVNLGLILLARIVPPRSRGRYMAWVAAAQLTGTVLGPLVGGLFVESALGWRGAFSAVLLLGLAMFVMLLLSPPVERLAEGRFRLDWLGVSLISVSIPALLVWLSFSGSEFDGFSPIGLALLVGGGILLVAALVVEWRFEAPVLPLRLLRARTPLVAAVALAGVGALAIAPIVLIPLYLQIGRGVSPTFSGLLVISTAVGSTISSFVVGSLTARTGRLRRYLVVGSVLLTIAAALLATLGPDAPFASIAAVLFLMGLGQGATVQFIILAAQNAVGVREVGVVSGFMNFVQLLAGATMTSLSGTLLGFKVVEFQAGGHSEAEAYAAAVPELFVWMAVLALLATIAVSLLPSIRLRRTIDLDDTAAR